MPARREISARPSWPTLSDSLIRSIRTRFSVHTGNLTGVSVIAGALGAKRLGLLREVAPKAAVIAVLVHPDNPSVQRDVEDVTKAATAISARIEVVKVQTETDVEAAFARIVREHADALMVNPDPSFMGPARAAHRASRTSRYSDDLLLA